MKRKYLADLIQWYHNKNRKPLILWGARQVGKTTLLLSLFAQQYFKNNYVYIDCFKNQEFVQFCNNNHNVAEIILFIEIKFFHKKIDEKTLIIIDEAQECLPIITLLKYFCQDYPQIPIIITGSMVRIKLERQIAKTKHNFFFPIGKINELTIYPLNFEEYLMNRNEQLLDLIKQHFCQKKPLSDQFHQLALQIFYEYCSLGGMPEVVQTFLKDNDFLAAKKCLKEIYDNYLNDMKLYQLSSESIMKTKKIFSNIFCQLNKENKNFKCALIKHGLRNRDLFFPLEWLQNSFLIHQSFQLKNRLTTPLLTNNESLFRVYLADMGIFAYQSKQLDNLFIKDDFYSSLSGIFFENYVAIELKNAGIDLFYWKGKNDAELEFIIQNKHHLVPIDVKKKRGTLNSLKHFCSSNHLDYAVKVSANNFGFNSSTKILTIPFYSFFLLCQDWKNEIDILAKIK